MNKTKGAFIIVVLALSWVAFAVWAGSEETKGKPQSYDYKGTVRAKGDGTHILKVETESGTMNFHYQRHGKKQCAGFKELEVGDTVKVTALGKKPVAEATCILKVRPDGTSK